MSKKKEMSRRTFLTKVAAGGAACAIVPRHVLGRGFTPPSDTLNVAAVGVGGMGRNNLVNLASQNIVALCDVDWGYAGKRFDRLDIDIESLKKRIELPAPPPPGVHPAGAGAAIRCASSAPRCRCRDGRIVYRRSPSPRRTAQRCSGLRG